MKSAIKMLSMVGTAFVAFASIAGCSGQSSPSTTTPDSGPATTRAASTCDAACDEQLTGCPEAGADWLATCKAVCAEISSQCEPEQEAYTKCEHAVGWTCAVSTIPSEKNAPSPAPKDKTKCLDEARAFGKCTVGK